MRRIDSRTGGGSLFSNESTYILRYFWGFNGNRSQAASPKLWACLNKQDTLLAIKPAPSPAQLTDKPGISMVRGSFYLLFGRPTAANALNIRMDTRIVLDLADIFVDFFRSKSPGIKLSLYTRLGDELQFLFQGVGCLKYFMMWTVAVNSVSFSRVEHDGFLTYPGVGNRLIFKSFWGFSKGYYAIVP